LERLGLVSNFIFIVLVFLILLFIDRLLLFKYLIQFFELLLIELIDQGNDLALILTGCLTLLTVFANRGFPYEGSQEGS